jgi:uncharacterized membrane protein YtjA (UPF0391 family)
MENPSHARAYTTDATSFGMTCAFKDTPLVGWRDNLMEGGSMLYYALVFLIVGLIAGALGITGVAAVASQIAWVLFLVGIVLLILHIAAGRRTPTI